MGMALGDLSKLRDWRARMGRMADGLAEKVAIEVAPKLEGLAEKGFTSKTDPYGAGWKPIKPATIKRGTRSALVRTGDMRDSLGYLPFGKRIKVYLGVFYARFHISTGRRTLPQAGKLPPTWRDVIRDETAKAFQRIAAGGR